MTHNLMGEVDAHIVNANTKQITETEEPNMMGKGEITLTEEVRKRCWKEA